MTNVFDNENLHRFEFEEQGLVAFANYRRNGNRYTIPHVEAPPILRGKGTAGRLMEGIVTLARERNFKIAPTCPYAIAWFRRHPGAGDMLD